MQHWLSGYANWYAKRNRRTGHLYQGRYKAFPVEDAGYFWQLSRYIHLNPCAGKCPLAERPESWPHSSYPGYHDRRRRVSWVLYDELHRYWVGRNGGGADPQKAYRRYVREGLETPVRPITDAMHGWVYGTESFLRRMIELGEGADEARHRSASRRIRSVAPAEVIAGRLRATHTAPTGHFGQLQRRVIAVRCVGSITSIPDLLYLADERIDDCGVIKLLEVVLGEPDEVSPSIGIDDLHSRHPKVEAFDLNEDRSFRQPSAVGLVGESRRGMSDRAS